MLAASKWHKSITTDRLIPLVEDSQFGMGNLIWPGICTICGNDQEGAEPDARNIICEACGADAVAGAEELLCWLSLSIAQKHEVKIMSKKTATAFAEWYWSCPHCDEPEKSDSEAPEEKHCEKCGETYDIKCFD